MDERLRQRYLKQMGFTPWVATLPLPGAAPSMLLDVQQLATEPAAGPASATNTLPTEPAVPVDVAALLKHNAEAKAALPSRPGQSAVTASVSEPSTVIPPSLMFTLQAHRGKDVHLWVEQQQADAPGLNREEQQQLGALLKLFAGTVLSEPKRFFCAPTAGRPMTAEIVRPMFDLFLRSLLGREGAVKLLLCAREETVQALFGCGRYQPLVRANVTFLPVSSLSEMLADPAAHKVPSWKAMQAHGFV